MKPYKTLFLFVWLSLFSWAHGEPLKSHVIIEQVETALRSLNGVNANDYMAYEIFLEHFIDIRTHMQSLLDALREADTSSNSGNSINFLKALSQSLNIILPKIILLKEMHSPQTPIGLNPKNTDGFLDVLGIFSQNSEKAFLAFLPSLEHEENTETIEQLKQLNQEITEGFLKLKKIFAYSPVP